VARGLGAAAAADDSASPRWIDDAVVYEVYPRSFQDSDGDGIGDLPGIRDRLPYLEWLGVDAIWLAPIYASPMVDFGYDVSDHRSIAPEYGTDRDFDLLVAAAHERGIRVLLDLVVSHTSIEHPWFRERPDFYIWADGPEPPNNWLASFGGPAWSCDPETGRLYLHSFYPEQPDLNWRNPAVREAMAAVVRHWIGRGADGFRVDAVDRMVKDAELRDDPPAAEPFPLPMPDELRARDLIHSRDAPEITLALQGLRDAAGEAPLIGEVYLPHERIIPYLDHFDGVFAFDLLHCEWGADRLGAAIERAVATAGVTWVTSNHDFPRAATRWGERSARAAAVLLLTLGGSAVIYQGEEIGMIDGPAPAPARDRYGRDACRRPMQWDGTPAGDFSDGSPWLPPLDPGARNVAAQRADPGSIVHLFRRLIELRRSLGGAPARVAAPAGVLAFDRGRHRVLINTGDRAATIALPAGSDLLLATAGPAPGRLAASIELDADAAAVIRLG
jgi:alpha-glucosidase